MKTVKLYIDFKDKLSGDVTQMKDHSAEEFVRRGWAGFVDESEIKKVKTVPKKTKK